MLLRSGREKPYQMPLHGSQSVEKQLLLTNMRTAPGKPGNSYLSDRITHLFFWKPDHQLPLKRKPLSNHKLAKLVIKGPTQNLSDVPLLEDVTQAVRMCIILLFDCMCRVSAQPKQAGKKTSWKQLFSLRETVKCYILTEDSKTVHFDIDEDGHHEISTKDSQSHEDIAWLSVFTRNEAAVTDKPLVGIKDSKNLVILTQRSKLNEFVLLCKGKKHLSLKVLKASCSEPDYPSMERCNMKTCNHEDPDFKQLSEDNNFFIMHYQGDSVQFQCYEDRSYYLCVNDDSLDIRKLENKEPNEDKKFYFRVSYLQEK